MSEMGAALGGIWRRIRCVGAWCIRHALQLLFFLLVRKNRVLMTAYNGLEYSCNPKYISEYLAEYGGMELIWGFWQPEKFARTPGIKAVRIKSVRWFYYSATASVVLTNTGFFSRAQPRMH